MCLNSSLLDLMGLGDRVVAGFVAVLHVVITFYAPNQGTTCLNPGFSDSNHVLKSQTGDSKCQQENKLSLFLGQDRNCRPEDNCDMIGLILDDVIIRKQDHFVCQSA